MPGYLGSEAATSEYMIDALGPVQGGPFASNHGGLLISVRPIQHVAGTSQVPNASHSLTVMRTA